MVVVVEGVEEVGVEVLDVGKYCMDLVHNMLVEVVVCKLAVVVVVYKLASVEGHNNNHQKNLDNLDTSF